MTEGLPVLQIARIEQLDVSKRWLVRHLWGHEAVGFVAGSPKTCKSWLGLDLALSVATGTPCLGRFDVERPGTTLVYLAEDSLASVRERVAHLAAVRGLDLDTLDLHVIASAGLRLDLERDRLRLQATLHELQPRLLVLDPLIRIHRLDENSSSDISGLLGYLRELNRQHHMAILLVHHMSKKARAHVGQALRGSGDLHAWSDSSCYLLRQANNRLKLVVEHRAAPAPEPMLLELLDDARGIRLEVTGRNAQPQPLDERVRLTLASSSEPRSRKALRADLQVNNKRLGDALERLDQRGQIQRTTAGWIATEPAQTDSRQLSLA